jgi:hypothetical protein
MAEIINLNRKRKEAARRDAERRAGENRLRFGRRKEERLQTRAEREKAVKDLDDKKLD